MNDWNFVAAAYAIAVIATMVLVVHSYLAMRRAEARADFLKRS